MISVDDVSLRRHRKLGIRTHDDTGSIGLDIGLQARVSRRDQLLASWRHRKLAAFCSRWKAVAQRFGWTIFFLVSILVVSVVYVAQMASVAYASSSFLFLSVGDFGSGTGSQHKVAERMAMFAAEYPVKFVTGLGDNFYETGIRNLEDKQITDKFERVYKDPSLTSIPWFMAIGDHDHRGNATAQVEYSQRSPFWRMPALYFVEHIRHGQDITLDLVVTDSVGLEGAILHASEPRRFDFEYDDILTGKADVYMHGHDHVGQHSIRGDGMVHIGNGVGGYINQPINRVDKQTIWAKDNYHGFCVHYVSKDDMIISFVNIRGDILHQAKIKSKKKKKEELRNEGAYVVTVV